MTQKSQILSNDATKAVKEITDIVRQLIELMDREMQALAKRDNFALKAVEDEKEPLTIVYENIAAEFRARLEEFRAVDRVLIDRLENLQRELAEKTQDNMDAMLRIGVAKEN